MYFMRSHTFEAGSKSSYRVMADEKIYDLVVKTKKSKDISLPHYDREISSLQMEPEAKFDGLFVRKGKVTLWVSNDERKLLTYLKAKVLFGRVRVKLHEVRGPGDDFWITELEKDDDD